MTTIPSEINPAAIKGATAEKHTLMMRRVSRYEKLGIELKLTPKPALYTRT